jgi:acyl-CoA reductase-like NAD-dependent aldehyde dehydrogenase
MIRAAWMEKIMSKTNDTSNVATSEHHATLADSELDAVSGGGLASAVAQVAAAAAKAALPDWSNRPPCGMQGPLSPWGDPVHPC